MPVSLRTLVPLLAMVLSSCVTLPPMMPTKTSLDAPYALTRSEILDQTSHMSMHIDRNRRVLYEQSSGGGGAAVGLLFGPLGVLANVAAIERVTKADVAKLQDRVDVDPHALFQEVAGTNSIVRPPAGSGQLRLTPYLYILKAKGDKLLVSSALLVEQGLGAEKWTGRVMYQLPGSYAVAELATLDASGQTRLRSEAAEGFRAMLQQLSARQQANMPEGVPLQFRSELLDPQFDFELRGELMAESADLVWIRVRGGVFAVRKASIVILKRG
jgi:hypothetical protein